MNVYPKYLLFSMLIALLIVSCEEVPEENPDVLQIKLDTIIAKDTLLALDTCMSDTCYTCNLNDSAQHLYDKLMLAYHDSCVECLENILIEWSEASLPATDIPDILQDVYAVFEEIYSPWDLARISDSEFGPGIYEGVSYYLVQDFIIYDYHFRTYGSEYFPVFPFHPRIANNAISSIYLNNNIRSAINCFLGVDYVPIENNTLFTPPFPVNESYNRWSFLSNFLFFFHGHWGVYWHLETQPEVERISFNFEKDSAQVHYRLGYQGGEVILGKENDAWIIVDHYMTWIE